MMAVSRIRPAAMVLLLAVVLTVGAGCKKQRANLNQKKLADLITTAESHEASKFKPAELQSLKATQQQVSQAYSGQQYDEAFTTSRQALDTAEAFLEEVKRLRAADLQNRVQTDISVAQANGGPSLDANKFQTIQELNEKGRERFSKNDWDGAIENLVEASREVDNLLAPLKQKAGTRLEEIKGRVKEMEAEQVRQHAPNPGIQVDELLKQSQALIEQRQYTTAQTMLSRTDQKINEAIESAKEVRSQIHLNNIESNLIIAMNKGAAVFFPETVDRAAQLYRTMLRDFEERRFDNVLQAAGLLVPQVERLRYDTRKRSAETKVASLASATNQLDEGGAREYLPGTVERLEALLQDARKQLNTLTEEGFEESEQITQAADEERTRILADFNELATTEISEANSQLEIATEVFQAMEDMFDVKIPGKEETSLERQLERDKQGMKADLGKTLEAARITLTTAQLKRDAGEYRDAILLSEDVQKTATEVQQSTYQVAALNSILEVNGALSYYAGQGGSQYAPKQVQEVQRILTEAREHLEQGRPKESVDSAALAKSQLDVLRQTLAEQGAQNLLEADEAIRSAVETRALEYSAGRMEAARSQLQAALKARNASDYKDVIEMAAEAKAIAEAAKAGSQTKFAQAQLAQASSQLKRAAQADAEIYAPRLYKEAGDKIAAAQQMLSGQKLTEAAALAKEAAEIANRAAYERVIEAEQQIETARHYEGWKYSSRSLADAINAAREARLLADTGDFDMARQRADEAISVAKAVSVNAKGSDVAVRLAGLRQDVQEGLHSGANYFQGDEVKKILVRMAELESTYSPETYEKVDAELRQLEARLQEILVNTPAVLERAVAEQTARRAAFLESPVDIETFAGPQLEESERLLRYAKIDFDKQCYAQSYTNLRKAIWLLDEIERILSSSAYNSQIADLFAEFVDAQDDFSHVLSLSETAMIQFAVNSATDQPQVVSIAGNTDPNEFRDRIEELYAKAKAIVPPPHKRLTHESVIALFDLALRSSQNFEKLVILNQFDQRTARDIIHTGYEQLRRSRSMQQEIEKTFLEPASPSLIVRKRQIAGTALY